jgi:hypothetical protein
MGMGNTVNISSGCMNRRVNNHPGWINGIGAVIDLIARDINFN